MMKPNLTMLYAKGFVFHKIINFYYLGARQMDHGILLKINGLQVIYYQNNKLIFLGPWFSMISKIWFLSLLILMGVIFY